MQKKIRRFIGSRIRSRYWSTSNLAKALQHTYSFDKPSAATLEDWDAWKEATQRSHPIIYWLTEETQSRVVWLPEKERHLVWMLPDALTPALHA